MVVVIRTAAVCPALFQSRNEFHQIGMSEMIANVSFWRIHEWLECEILHAQKSVVKTVLACHKTDSSRRTQWHCVKRFETFPSVFRIIPTAIGLLPARQPVSQIRSP
jgi:hypothetical protein